MEELLRKYPVLNKIANAEEIFWENTEKKAFDEAITSCPISKEDIEDASRRLERFSKYFTAAYPETRATDGILESPLCELTKIKDKIGYACNRSFVNDRWLLKLDSQLPISGSIKARGGIYEVLTTAERIALNEKYITENDDYSAFASQRFKDLFSKYTIAVGSTGNLGLSIGLVGAGLGFKAEIHMSSDARQWKKDMLRKNGAHVLEYDGDYSLAVEQGRKEASKNPYCHFVDDENSKTLFLGYAVAAFRLKKQLDEMGIDINENSQLYVYLPCGVGGGPGGVAFGLKLVFGDNVHCFFAEPTHSCCMTVGMITGKHNEISVQDLGLDNRTIADGLAVGRASGFVGKLMAPFIDGCYTVSDTRMSALLGKLYDEEKIFLEPSSLAGLCGPMILGADDKYRNGIHLFWATGGGMVPDDERAKYYEQGDIDAKHIFRN